MKAKLSSLRRRQDKRLVFDHLEPRLLLSSASPNALDDSLLNSIQNNSAPPVAVIASDSTNAQLALSSPQQARQMEYLNRGMVAVRKNTTQVYIGWRLLGTDPSSIAFNLYRSAGGGAAVKLNSSPLTTTTDYVDTPPSLTVSNSYYVRPVVGGVEQAPSESYTLAASSPVQQFLSVPLIIPAGVTTPDGVTCTYSANDCSVGDVDGDGQYEIIVKWDPSNSHDNGSQDPGYSGNVYLDAYKLNGTRLWRIDLGINIRAGAHYTQFIVYDLDGDGKAEIAMKTAPGTKDGLGNNVILGNDNPNADYRNSDGRILTGPEYLTIFNGQTGAAMATTNYLPARGNVSDWGDNYGNRSERYLAAVAYLDGTGKPSLVECRGYYSPESGYAAKNFITAWNWRNGTLTHVWTFEAATGEDGNINQSFVGQGNHNLSIGDVDGDGKDEIIYGACAIDDNGQPLYNTLLGHGDAMQMTDMDLSRPGEEVFDVHETPSLYEIYGGEFRNAATGQDYYGIDGGGTDVGRGNAFDIDPNYPGYESWTSNNGYIYDAQGTAIYAKPSNMFINFGIWWDANLGREELDGTTISPWNYTDHVRGTNLVYAPAGLSSNNGSKHDPCLVADILGDWREEVIWRKTDSTALQIWTTTISATNRIYTLMDDTQYRESVAFQNVAYNQPTDPSFYLGYGMPTPPTPNIYLAGSNHVLPIVIATTPLLIDAGGTAGAYVTQIGVNFNEQLNSTDANAAGNYELRRAVNGIFGDSDDVVYVLTPNYVYNSQTGASLLTLNLGGLLPADTYRLTIRASGGAGGLRDISGNYLDGDENSLAGGDYIRTFTILPVTIAGRYIFYNNSKFDAISDNGAIATDKTALLPGLTGAFGNYTSYSLGINGIMIDIQNLANHSGLSAADFQFQVGNGAGWTAAPDPISVSAPGGGGTGSSDRVTIIWADNAIQNQWLQVTVLADANTGLGSADVFCFGNAIGESGNSAADAVVDSADEAGSRTHKTGFSSAAIDNHYDYNRDGRVNVTDDLIARHNRTDGVGGNPLQLIDPPLGAPLSAGDTLQPLSAVADITTSQPATADVAILPPAVLLEDDAISRTAALSAENSTSRPLMPSEDQSASDLEMPMPSAAEIAQAAPAFAPVQTPFAPAPLPACPVVPDLASLPLSSVAVQFPGVLHPRDIAGNAILFSASLNAVASDQWVPAPERWNQITLPERVNQISTAEPENRIDNAPHNPAAPLQDRLHDAVFARSLARLSLAEEDGQPGDSSAPADIETFLNDCLPAKSDKSPAYAIDNVFAALRHKKE
ncbi:MAG: rhamnogalacturonan lyase [Thermoguttaceae bacterium]|jgi:rhamnogalacturonan endolyase